MLQLQDTVDKKQHYPGVAAPVREGDRGATHLQREPARADLRRRAEGGQNRALGRAASGRAAKGAGLAAEGLGELEGGGGGLLGVDKEDE